jgi:NADPH:quinone reductase-like Zn-dependent oxidoreductase
MLIPKTTASWFVTGTSGFEDLKLEKSVPIPEIGEYDCLVQIQAVSLNYRDLAISKASRLVTQPFPILTSHPQGRSPLQISLPRVPCSDACGKIISTGSKVSRFQPGDTVCTLFNQKHQYGPLTPESAASDLGGMLDGTLCQYAVFPETGLVFAPSNLTPAQSGTLSCAPLTAWNALYGLLGHELKPGDTVISQGTGGVGIAAIQFAIAAGATVIATTSSDAKGQRLKDMGVHHVINYNSDPNWGSTAKKLTPDGTGADHIIEIGGPNTLQQSFDAVKMGGVINIIGFLGGMDSSKQPSLLNVLTHDCILRGIRVGSREQFEAMNSCIEKHDIKSVVDEKIFAFEDAKDAYQYVWDQKHFGNVVVNVSD